MAIQIEMSRGESHDPLEELKFLKELVKNQGVRVQGKLRRNLIVFFEAN
jgi:hypothetical protein